MRNGLNFFYSKPSKPLRGDLAIFCPADSGWVGGVQSARKKSLKILHHCQELNPGHEEDRE